jgi:4-hydroxybenzoate polyprenyltransferase
MSKPSPDDSHGGNNGPGRTAGASDIEAGHWLIGLWPEAARPYARLVRLDRPIGTWLLLLPGWWALALAADGWPNWWYFLLFGIGAIVMRGAGCVVNDLADRKYDAAVARTATRPIASGAISVPYALVFMAVLSAIGLLILLQFNRFAIAVGALSLVLIVTYPYMKRITYWPQAFLGLTFNWGALLGWAAVRGSLDPAAVMLYAAGFFWTLGYDTIYALQDKDDDALVGIKSTALLFGGASRQWIGVFFSLTILLLAATVWLADPDGFMTWTVGITLGLGALHFARQIWALDPENPKNCLRQFKANRDFGLIILAGFIVSRVLG